MYTATVHKPVVKPLKRELVITHVFKAPREQVWKAWTNPGIMIRWWGPKSYTSPAFKIDLRVGGTYVGCMRTPQGKDIWSTGTYRKIVPQERLVFTDSFADEHGNAVPASYYGMTGNWPPELLVTVIFEEQGDGTRMTLRHAGIPTDRLRELTEVGWKESFHKLARVLG